MSASIDTSRHPSLLVSRLPPGRPARQQQGVAGRSRHVPVPLGVRVGRIPAPRVDPPAARAGASTVAHRPRRSCPSPAHGRRAARVPERCCRIPRRCYLPTGACGAAAVPALRELAPGPIERRRGCDPPGPAPRVSESLRRPNDGVALRSRRAHRAAERIQLGLRGGERVTQSAEPERRRRVGREGTAKRREQALQRRDRRSRGARALLERPQHAVPVVGQGHEPDAGHRRFDRVGPRDRDPHRERRADARRRRAPASNSAAGRARGSSRRSRR